MESRQVWLASRVFVKILVEWRTIIVLDMTHVLVFGVMALMARRTWSPTERAQRPRRARPGESLGANFDDMRSTLLLAAALSRHGYADGRRADLCVVTLRLANLIIIEVLGLVVVIDGCLIVIGVIGGVVIVAVQDVLTRLAYSKIARLREEFA